MPKGLSASGLAAAVAVAVLWFGVAELNRDVVRPATAVASILFATVCLFITARRTEGRERRGWQLALAGTAGAMLPLVGSVAGIVFGVGLILLAGAGWRSDRYRLLDASVALTTVLTMAVAYLYPEIAQMRGMQRFDAYMTSTQIVFAFSCIVFMTYRCGPRARPDAWLVGGGFVLATIVGMPGLLDVAENHASTWVPTRWWEIGLPVAGVMVGAGARQRLRRTEPQLEESGSGAEPNAALVGDVMLAGLVGAFVLAPPGTHALTLTLLATTIVLRHARARLIVGDNQRLAANAVEEGERRLELYRSSFVALATAIEARDGYTGRHSEETVELAAGVCERLGLSADERSLVKTVALLHDVGKIGIPDAVLHKTGDLDNAEWHVMRQHPVIGERILRTVPGLEEVATAIRHEHERWDGAGYPDGLIAERIPLASRIVLVCDAWHAMTSDRPYRARMPQWEALAELRRCAGTQFDPRVVDALVDLVQAP